MVHSTLMFVLVASHVQTTQTGDVIIVQGHHAFAKDEWGH